MITLQIDFNYLQNYLNLSSQKVQQYKNKSVEEIVECEVAQGNEKAGDLLEKILNDPRELLKFYQLTKAENRYEILKNLPEEDLKDILPLLEPKDLVLGLNFFTKDALIEAIQDMPKEEITTVLFSLMAPVDFLRSLSNKDMNNFLESENIDRSYIMKAMEKLPLKALKQMQEAATGKSCEDTNQDEILKNLENMKDDDFLKTVECLKPEFKMELIYYMTKERPKLWNEFDEKTLTEPMGEYKKEDVVTAMSNLKPETLINVVDELPKELLAVVVTQIDPENFAKLLGSKYQELLADAIASM